MDLVLSKYECFRIFITLSVLWWESAPGINKCRQAIEAPLFISNCLTKQQLRSITAALTGQGSFYKHLFVKGVTNRMLCRACMETEETAAHVLLSCPAVASYRVKYFDNLGTLWELVGSTKALLAFLEELGWIERESFPPASKIRAIGVVLWLLSFITFYLLVSL